MPYEKPYEKHRKKKWLKLAFFREKSASFRATSSEKLKVAARLLFLGLSVGRAKLAAAG